MRKLNKDIYSTYYIEKDSQVKAYAELLLFLVDNEGVLIESITPGIIGDGDDVTHTITFTASE